MNDDELNERLRRIDPSSSASVHPTDGPQAAALLEQIMNTPIDLDRTTTPAPSRRGRARWLYSALATAVVAGGIAVAVLASRGDDNDNEATSVSYQLDGGVAMGMCIRVDAYQPEPGLLGFRGTVTAVEGDTVTLHVSQWYAGGPADDVVLHVNNVPTPALDGMAFEAGGDYLVAVMDGQVRTCGISGPYSAELEALYARWFPA